MWNWHINFPNGVNVPQSNLLRGFFLTQHSHWQGLGWNEKYIHCKKGKVVLTQFGHLSFLLLVCIVKHSDVPLSALDSKQIKNLIRLSRTLANIMGEYFANEIVQSCGKWHETEVTKMG